MWYSFFFKFILVFENNFFRSTAQYANFHREYYPSCVTSCDECIRSSCRYWGWQRSIYFLVNIFVWHTFPMSKSSIKTKTVLTMTDMTKSTELQAFIRQKNGYKVTLKISLCICVALSWDELKVQQIYWTTYWTFSAIVEHR